ncbi:MULTISPECIES: VirB3 family type IV secretion system protein [Rhizobium]|uniref:type IV secretion system protein VirB3 n=1 Tax=Rhizobium TaxID=379 RepID=UPI001B31A689|nr:MULTISPECIES: VirB3 family type IV secretion system protein [Rhizobium]MBX4911653.1 VirB3 family type IV secretion system protein [Rhizobium bangladeshense]MBX5254436.1 VirB3 family type IV secretion system protein [Rhizobium sp. NLR4b]MBX5260606.1 VirB3 family type IV secretion system protein [Rhizobium sp. NLR16b]MBX5266707.1 VirB3 family type IV secretion system protein [Rhizobium sp. NLR16a]MBX5297113.1 VirB3 family type IV secretion system protein [Rhizobium sp. NLR15a]
MSEFQDEKPSLTPLVIGLTRSPTLWGVPYMAVVLIVGITIIGWLATNHLLALLIAPVAYLVLFSLCAWDNKILEVLQVTSRKTPRTPNKRFWGTNSYGP